MASVTSKQKLWRLTETEDFPSFQHWQLSAVYFFTHGDNECYRQFFNPNVTWKKATPGDNTRGLLPTDTQTAMQRKDDLDQLLILICQYAPHYIKGQITQESTSISSIWGFIRSYYGFEVSETTFMGFIKIKQELNERPQRLYHRMVEHVRDSLLQKDQPLRHNGAIPSKDEELSPTLERLLVLLWLDKLHPELPDLVVKTFSYDLASMTLKDLQPRISQALPSLLAELKQRDSSSSLHAVSSIESETSTVQAVRGFNQNSTKRQPPSQFDQNKFQSRPSTKPPQSRPYCRLCAAEGRNPTTLVVSPAVTLYPLLKNVLCIDFLFLFVRLGKLLQTKRRLICTSSRIAD